MTIRKRWMSVFLTAALLGTEMASGLTAYAANDVDSVFEAASSNQVVEKDYGNVTMTDGYDDAAVWTFAMGNGKIDITTKNISAEGEDIISGITAEAQGGEASSTKIDVDGSISAASVDGTPRAFLPALCPLRSTTPELPMRGRKAVMFRTLISTSAAV